MKRKIAIVLLSIIGLSFISSQQEKIILFYGDSLTAGYGLSPEFAFPALIQKKLKEEGENYKVINSGLSGETSAGGLARIDWVLRQPVDVFVLELGANDGLRGLEINQTRQNLQSIIDKVKAKNPSVKIVVTGMMVPPNMGQDYGSQFQKVFPELAKKNNASLIPFLLDGVGGDPKLNQADGIHPTAEGHKIVAENVWKVLAPIL